MLEVIGILWVIIPFVLIPLFIYERSKRKKNDRFIAQLYSEQRISLVEYTNRLSENAPYGRQNVPQGYYNSFNGFGAAPPAAPGVPGAPGVPVFPGAPAGTVQQPATAPFAGTFIGPPVPPELLQQRREAAAKAQELAQAQPVQPAPLDAVSSVTELIAREQAAAKAEETAQPAAETVQAAGLAKEETSQPAAETVQAAGLATEETSQPAAETVQKAGLAKEETSQPAAETVQAVGLTKEETSQPAADSRGVLPEFIGPPLPPAIIGQRRAMADAAAIQQQWESPQLPQMQMSQAPQQFGQNANAYVPPVRKKHSVNPASAMLMIGSALVIIAGMIYSTAQWSDMSEWQRTGVIALASAFFFGVSVLAHKKLKLESTGMAFYMLGSVFTAITFVTIGYFGLLGKWMSVKGGGFWLLYSLAALLVTLFSAGAVKIYRKGAFVHAVLYGGLTSFTLMSVQIFNGSPDMWALFLNITAALPIFLLYKQKLRVGNELYDDQMKLFTIILSTIYAVSAMPYMLLNSFGRWSLPCFLTMILWTAQAAVYGSLTGNKLLKRIHPILVTILSFEFAMSLRGTGDETKLLVFGVCIFTAAAVYRYAGPLRTRLSDILFPVMLGSSFFTANKAAVSGGQLLVCTTFLTVIFLMQALTKEKDSVSRGFLKLLPLSVLVTAGGMTGFLYYFLDLDDIGMLTLYAGLTFVFAMVFTFVKQIRTIFSDVLFPFAILICYGSCAGTYISSTDYLPTFGCALLVFVNVLIHACENPEKRMVRHFAYMLPFALAVLGQGAAVLVNGYVSTSGHTLALTFGCTVFAGAAAMRFIPRLRSRLSDILNIVAVAFAALVCRGMTGVPAQWCAAGLALAAVILTAFQCFEKKDLLRDTRLFVRAMPLMTIWAAFEISSAVSLTADPGTFSARDQMLVLIFMLICFAAAFAYMNISRLRSGVSAAAFPVALMCGGISVSSGGTAGSCLIGTAGFVLMAVIMLIQNSEEGLIYKALRFFIAVPFIGIAATAGRAVSLSADGGKQAVLYLSTGLFLAGIGAGFRYSRNFGADIRTTVSDTAFAVLTLICAAGSYAEKPFFAIWTSLAAAALILMHIVERKPRNRWFVLISRLIFPCVLTLTVTSVSAAVMNATADRNILFSTEGTLVPNVIFILLMFALSVLFLKVRKIRTILSDFFLPAALVIGCREWMSGGRIDLLAASALCMAALCGMLLMYGLEKDSEPYKIVHRIAAPLALLAAVMSTGSFISALDVPRGLADSAAFLGGSVILAGFAALFTALANRKQDSRFVHSQYSWAAVSGITLFEFASLDDASTAQLVLKICAVLMCAAVYLLCGRQKKNLAGIIPVTAMIVISDELGRQLSFADRSGLAGTDHRPYTCAVLGVMFLILCALSRFTNRESFVVNKDKRLVIDFAALGMFAAPLISLSGTGDEQSTSWFRFIALAELAVFFLNLIRKGHEKKANLILLTLASAAGCAMIWARPFLLTGNAVLKAKIDLIPLLLFSVLVRIIWKDHRKLAADVSFFVQLAAFAVLLFDALTHQSLSNTLIVLCVTLTIMLVSFAVKSGRWFAISAASFAGLTIYITRGFVGRVEWWVYLLTAGLILIAVASVNEYMKSRGQSIKDAGRHFLSRWKKNS